jgi:hypothetical protein
MPIQITELNISVSVNQPGGSGQTPAASPEKAQQQNDKLVEECVEQVMRILQDKKER